MFLKGQKLDIPNYSFTLKTFIYMFYVYFALVPLGKYNISIILLVPTQNLQIVP